MRARKAALLSVAAMSTTMLTTGVAGAVEPGAGAAVPAHQVDFTGEANGFGSGVSRTSCDVNGDQIDDFVVGDRSWIRAPHGQVGAAYVLLGSTTVTGGDVSDPATAGAVRIDGPSVTVPAGAWVGWSASCLGDVNGDGIDDFVAGTGSRGFHDVAVVFGARDFGPIDLDDLGERGYLISDPGALDTTSGDRATDNFGSWVGAPGDIDGDGLDDIAIGDTLADGNGLANSGRVWVVRGKASSSRVDVQADTDQVLLKVDGAAAGDRMATVDAAGDVNGDGKDDLLLGSYVAASWPGTTATGAGYAILGGGPSVVDLSQPLGAAGFAVHGPARDKDRLGISATAIGDIDGDGLDDIALGGDGVSGSGLSGGVAVVRGSTSTAPVLTDPSAAELTVFHCADGAQDLDCTGSTKVARGYWVDGAHAESKAGFAVAGIPDANGDGVPDLIVGAYAEGARGTAYVLYSEPARTAALDLAALGSEQGERHAPVATGTSTAGTYGRTVGSAGDFDGNGDPDFFYGGASNNLALVLRGALGTEVDLAADEAAAGRPVEVTAAVQTLVPSVDPGLVDGTLAIRVDGAPVADLQQVPVTDGSASFTLPAGSARSLELRADFTPADDTRLAAARVTTTVEVAKLAATGRVVLDREVAAHGGEVEAVFLTDDEISGAVVFEVDGSPVASAELSAGRAAVTLRDLALGEHRIRATYAGTDTVAAFATEEVALAVQKATPRLGAVALSKRSTVYGRDAVTLTVTVPGGHGGRVGFLDGGRQVATAIVGHDGLARTTIVRPSAGKHRYTARFHGTDTLQGGDAAGAVLTVAKARVRTMTVSGAPFERGTRPRVRVLLGKLTNATYPVGTVTVRAGTQRVTVRLDAADRGRAVVRLGKSRAALRVSATFRPTDRGNIAAAKAAPVTIRVRR